MKLDMRKYSLEAELSKKEISRFEVQKNIVGYFLDMCRYNSEAVYSHLNKNGMGFDSVISLADFFGINLSNISDNTIEHYLLYGKVILDKSTCIEDIYRMSPEQYLSSKGL